MRASLATFLVCIVPAFALAAPGDLDPEFGAGGVVLQTDVSIDTVGGIALEPDGRLVVAASRSGFGGDGALFLFRYGPDGRLDPAFGTNGSVSVAGPFNPAVTVDADGALLVASTRCDPSACVATLARYAADGRLDPSFVAPDRSVVSPTVAEVIARQPDGKILVGGNDGYAPSFGVWLARYNADGTNDPTFGSDGVTGRSDVSHHGSSLDSLLVQSDGSILAGVTGGTIEGVYGDIERFTASGADADRVPTTFGYPLLARAPGVGVIAAGTVFSAPNPGQIVLARYDDGLQQVAGFGGNGPTGGAHDMLVDVDGRVVVAAALGDRDTDR